MKKTLLTLLTLSLPNIGYAHTIGELHTHGAKIEMVVPYEHPKPKKIGDNMPMVNGTKTYYMDILVLHSEGIEEAIRKEGYIQAYDENDDGIADYEVVRRNCDMGKKYENYAILDVPNKLMYLDSIRDGIIDEVVKNISTLEDKRPSILKTCKQENKDKKALSESI